MSIPNFIHDVTKSIKKIQQLNCLGDFFNIYTILYGIPIRRVFAARARTHTYI